MMVLHPKIGDVVLVHSGDVSCGRATRSRAGDWKIGEEDPKTGQYQFNLKKKLNREPCLIVDFCDEAGGSLQTLPTGSQRGATGWFGIVLHEESLYFVHNSFMLATL